MALIRWRRPTSYLPSVVEDMNRVFDDLVTRPFSLLEPIEWRGPAVDVYETDDEVVVQAELPGVKKDDVQLHIEGEVLTLRGESQEVQEAKEDGHYRREIRRGSFHRQIHLPMPVKREEITAKYEDGILTVRAPKALEAAVGKRIDIE